MEVLEDILQFCSVYFLYLSLIKRSVFPQGMKENYIIQLLRPKRMTTSIDMNVAKEGENTLLLSLERDNGDDH